MNKQEFLARLRKSLAGLPQNDIEERLIFYSEMINDRIEEGLSECEAVKAIGTVSDIAAQILADTPLHRLVKEKVTPNRNLKPWEIVLLVLGSPLWLPVLIAALALLLAVYIALWSIIIALWTAELALAAGALSSVISAMLFVLRSSTLTGMAMLGAGICCAGMSIFLFFACKAGTKGTLLLTDRFALAVKGLFIRKEAV